MCIKHSVMIYKTTATAPHAKTPSLRTTIPIEIVRQIKLAAGDTLDWSIEKNKKFIMVRKLKKSR